jgi:hypothetical protein
MTTLTNHAMTRSQQRGIPPLIIEWLKCFGARTRDGRGAEVLWFDKGSRRQLAGQVGTQIVERLGHFLDAYLVLSDDDQVITVGWRTKRLPRS